MSIARSTKDEPPLTAQLLAEMRALRDEQAQLRRLFTEFADAYLNARFPYGQPTDRWARPRGSRL